jgi:phosphopantothenoylcysteine synthetase/decarboxylase
MGKRIILALFAGLILSSVVSAEEMYKESLKYFSNCDIAIMAAAVAD